MDFSGCLNDGENVLDPVVKGCRGDFDFTIQFETIFFSLIPNSLIICLSLPRLLLLYRRPSIVGGVILRTSKLLCLVALTAIDLSLLVLCILKSQRLRAFFLSSAAVSFVSALCLILLSHLEHIKSPRPSMLLSIFLSLTLLLDIAQCRTLWLASNNTAEDIFCRLVTGAVVIKAACLALESQHKSKWLRWNDSKQHSPEEWSGFYVLGVFSWLNALFLKGYRKTLTLADLFPLDPALSSEHLQKRLADNLNDLPGLSRAHKKHTLAWALIKTLAGPLLLPVAPRFAMGAFQLCQSFLINSTLSYLGDPSASKNVGYGLIGATVLIYLGIALSFALYWYFQERAVYMMRGALVGTIYSKTTESRPSMADNAAMTLMSGDVERIVAGFTNIHELWACAAQVAVACWLLSDQIGVGFVATLIVVACCTALTAVLTRITGPRQKAWMQKIQKRVGLTSTLIGQMKSLKISGLAGPVEASLQNMRVDELRIGARFRMIQSWTAALGVVPLCISPVMVFAFAAGTLHNTTVFTSMSYITLSASPLSSLFQSIPIIKAALTCLTRIQRFIEMPPREDYRRPRRDDVSLETTAHGRLLDEKTVGINGFDSEDASAPAFEISNGNFGWDESGRPTLRDINLQIPSAKLTIVIGPIASGKSTLCKALLGEVPLARGRVWTNFCPSRGRVGYCDQSPYLSNATIRENIVGFSAFDSDRYERVIETTMLRYDLDMLLPQGDQTQIGSDGIILSGGQKQRVSIARALYHETTVFIFDDVFRGLDADTEQQIFKNVFSAGDGILRQRDATVVLCTHSVRHLPAADHIVVLAPDGTVAEHGTFQQLINSVHSCVHGLGINQESEDDTNKVYGDLDIVSSSSAANQRPLQTLLPKVGKPEAKLEEEEAEGGGRKIGDAQVLRHYFSRITLSSKIVFLMASVSWGFFYSFSPVWLTFWSEDVTGDSDSATREPNHSTAFWLGLYALLQIMTPLSILLMSLTVFTRVVREAGARLHKEALDTVLNAPLRFFSTTDIGVIVNMFSQDMALLDGQLPMALSNLSLYIFSSIGQAGVIAGSSPYLVATYPLLAAVLWCIQKFYLRTSRQLRLLDLEAKSPLYSHFIDTTRAINTLRALGWVPHHIALNHQQVDASQRPAYLLAVVQRWLGLALRLVVGTLAVTVVALATQLSKSSSSSSAALIGAGLVTLMSLSEGLMYVVQMYANLETSAGAVARLKAFSERVRPEGYGDDSRVVAVESPAEWPTQGRIRLDGVSATYNQIAAPEQAALASGHKQGRGSKHSPEDLVLKDLTLDIVAGEKVAICGRSGSGKSSLVLVLLRLLDPVPSCRHNVTIDDIRLSFVNRQLLRERVIAVPQEPVFLSDSDGTYSFRDNLEVSGASPSDEDCRSALDAVGLWSLVEASGGLRAALSADVLSQGQKQLFSLARAVLRCRVRKKSSVQQRLHHNSGGEAATLGHGGVLILDEFTSGVDRDTERVMLKIIGVEFRAYTIVMVSHRLEMVMDFFDTVIVMDSGRIAEKGRPATLLTQGSRFRELWTAGSK